MARIERTLEAIAARGTPRGSADLISRLESDLRQVQKTRRLSPAARRPLSWWQGVGVAAATAAVILVVVLVGILIANLAGEETDVVNPPSTTTLVPGPELFEGVIIPIGSSIEIVGQDRYIALLEDLCCPENVFSDLSGGVVFQEGDSILWAKSAQLGVAAASPTPSTIAGGQSASLEGLVVIDGEPTVVVYDSAMTDEGRFGSIDTLGLDTGIQTSIHLPYGSEVTVDRVSYGGGLFVVSLVDGTGSRFELMSREGTPAPVDANPHPGPGESLVRQAVLTEDGSLLAYIERQPSALTGGKADLVIVDMTSGSEIDRRPVMDLGDRIVSFDGEFVVIARRLSDPTATPAVVVLHLPSGSWAGGGGFSGP